MVAGVASAPAFALVAALFVSVLVLMVLPFCRVGAYRFFVAARPFKRASRIRTSALREKGFRGEDERRSRARKRPSGVFPRAFKTFAETKSWRYNPGQASFHHQATTRDAPAAKPICVCVIMLDGSFRPFRGCSVAAHPTPSPGAPGSQFSTRLAARRIFTR